MPNTDTEPELRTAAAEAGAPAPEESATTATPDGTATDSDLPESRAAGLPAAPDRGPAHGDSGIAGTGAGDTARAGTADVAAQAQAWREASVAAAGFAAVLAKLTRAQEDYQRAAGETLALLREQAALSAARRGEPTVESDRDIAGLTQIAPATGAGGTAGQNDQLHLRQVESAIAGQGVSIQTAEQMASRAAANTQALDTQLNRLAAALETMSGAVLRRFEDRLKALEGQLSAHKALTGP